MVARVGSAVGEVERGLQQLYGSRRTGHSGSRVSNIALLGSGYETDVFAYSLEPEGASPRQELVLRLYAGEDVAEKAAREYGAMRRLRDAGYPVPQVLAVGGDASPLGRPYLIMERIDGVALEWSPPEERQREIQALHCRLMADLHALEGCQIIPDSPLVCCRDPYAVVDHDLMFLSTLLDRLNGQEPPSLRGALAWLAARRSEVPCARLRVIHGDFHRNNILVRADGAAFVIDWSNVRLGDHRTDLAWNRLLRRADTQTDEGETELHLYEQLAAEAVSRIEYFEVIAAARLLLSQLVSLQIGAAREGMRPEAEDLMRRNSAFTLSVAELLQRRTGLPMPDLEDSLSALLR